MIEMIVLLVVFCGGVFVGEAALRADLFGLVNDPEVMADWRKFRAMRANGIPVESLGRDA